MIEQIEAELRQTRREIGSDPLRGATSVTVSPACLRDLMSAIEPALSGSPRVLAVNVLVDRDLADGWAVWRDKTGHAVGVTHPGGTLWLVDK